MAKLLDNEEEDEFYKSTYGGFNEVTTCIIQSDHLPKYTPLPKTHSIFNGSIISIYSICSIYRHSPIMIKKKTFSHKPTISIYNPLKYTVFRYLVASFVVEY